MSLPIQPILSRDPKAFDESPVDLNADQQAASAKAIGEVIGSLQFVRELAGKNELTVSNRYNCLYVAQAELKRIFTLLGEERDKDAEDLMRENLHRAQRESQRLREEMAKGVTPEAVTNKLSEMNKLVERWWKSLGFTLVDGKFTARYSQPTFSAVLSGMLDRHAWSSEEDTPVSATARKMQTIEELGTHVDMVESGGGDPKVLDTPRSREYISKQLEDRFPGSWVTEWRSMSCGWHGSKGSFIREVEVHIPIQSLTDKETNEDSEVQQ